MAPRLSGPTGSRSIRSASNADSSSEGAAPSPVRRASRTWTGCSPIRLSANVSTLADDGSSHWTSSIGKHDRRLGSESLQCASDCNAERARIGASRSRPRAGARPRARASSAATARQDSLEHVLEQVAEAGVSEPSLRLGRPRHEDTKSALTRGLDARQPDRRLSDPRSALEHQCRRSLEASVEECVDGVELRISADDRA